MENYTKILSEKTLIGAKSLCIRIDRVEGFIRVYNLSKLI